MEQQRDVILCAERSLLHTLGFHFHAEHPYKHLLRIVKQMSEEKVIPEKNARDLAQAIELCIKKDGLGYEVFNVTHDNNSVNLTAKEIINQFFPNVKMKREMGKYESILSSKKIKESLGFKPIHDWKNYFKV